MAVFFEMETIFAYCLQTVYNLLSYGIKTPVMILL